MYGTSRFGSGYPYGNYGSYVNQRPLPFVFYPTPVSYHYYGGDEVREIIPNGISEVSDCDDVFSIWTTSIDLEVL